MGIPSNDVLTGVYGEDAARAAERLGALAARFDELFGVGDPEFFTASGRTEIIGNHTDHNGGKILAASITMDSIGAAERTDDGIVTIWSEGYPEAIVVDTGNIDKIAHGGGSTTLVAGMLEATVKRGFKIGGFNAVCSSEVIPSAGVSSSASFEMLVCEMINHLYNDDAIERADYARIGQYAENVWWDKASGLMDQMACAVGGTILLDFSDGVKYERVDFGFDELGCDLVIVNTGKGHADLSAEYSSVPNEMHDVAAALGVKNLCESSEDAVLSNLVGLREKCGDRAVLRALHYFEECARVEAAEAAINAGDKAAVLDIITASGRSSWEWLQNAVVPGMPEEQPIPMALALTQLYLRRIGSGVCRLHGGGFAGVIMCVLPKAETAGYVDYMASYFGRENVYLTNIRQTGAACLGRA
ncbi:galactokinase [Thermophilibacter provencensis]|uniref:Galactokinase family protein n=1 Tax=Thermophilibacter provencensis TaxID=1852386 RepID=A0ABT7V4M3_9ACTN|nr:galactokinase family protein [Thermophilibacter provencensis]MDM8271547.1 galactokinase family protein [Thermophilibacter provencensis]